MKCVVIPYSGHSFDQMFLKYSPFFKNVPLEYSAYMFKRYCENTGIEILPFNETTVRECDVILHFNVFRGNVLKKYNEKYHFYIAREPNIVIRAHRPKKLEEISRYVYDAVVTTHSFEKKDSIYQIRWPIYFPAQIVAKDNIDFAEKKLACMFAGNKYAFGEHEQYSIRRKIVAYFEKYDPDDFDLYGIGWDDSHRKLKVYRGSVDDKLEISSHYKFAFCLENERFVKANISEKIFDAMIAGTVPIYEGIEDIEDFVPKNCFIRYSNFNSIEDCVKYLKSMTEDEYMQYKKNIEQYILSEETRSKFSAKNMRDQIVRAYQERTAPKKHRALWLLDLYTVEQKIYNILCRLQKYLLILKMKIG